MLGTDYGFSLLFSCRTAAGRCAMEASRAKHAVGEGESASAQMPLRKCAAGTRFQVALERQRPCFVPKRDHDVEFPRPIPPCVDTFARVMTDEPRPCVRSDAGVVAVSIAEAPEHVHEPFRSQHGGVGGAIVVPLTLPHESGSHRHGRRERSTAVAARRGEASPPTRFHLRRYAASVTGRATEDTILRVSVRSHCRECHHGE